MVSLQIPSPVSEQVPAGDICRYVKGITGKFKGFVYQRTGARFANCRSPGNLRQQKRVHLPHNPGYYNDEAEINRYTYKALGQVWRDLVEEEKQKFRDAAAVFNWFTYPYYVRYSYRYLHPDVEVWFVNDGPLIGPFPDFSIPSFKRVILPSYGSHGF